MKLVILDGHTLNPGDNPWDPLAALGDLTVHDRTAAADVVERAADAEILLTNKTPVDANAIQQLPKLQMIAVLATGFNIVDTAAARARSIPVCNVPEYSSAFVAQHAMALLLELCDQVGLHAQSVRNGDWITSADFSYWRTPMIELQGRTAGIVGLGRIGRRFARLCQALDMPILAHSRTRRDPLPAPFEWASVEEIFERADVVSLHCPQTPETQGFVNADLLARMKPTSFLINTSRGGLIREADLAAALAAGRPAAAAVDVLAAEPMRADHPLRCLPNCLITPHVAWSSLPSRQRLLATTVANIQAFRSGQPINVVN